MSDETNFKINITEGKVVKIPITADGEECLGNLTISWEKCLAAARGNEGQAELIYEAATNDGLPGYRVPIDLLED